MDTNIRCFMIEPTGRVFWSKRACSFGVTGCPEHNGGNHRAKSEYQEGGHAGLEYPSQCACGYEFSGKEYYASGEQECRRLDTGEVLPLGEEKPVGAMWYATWIEDSGVALYGEEPEGTEIHFWRGPDNRVLCVMCPGGEWMIDARASNCSRPTDNKHRCWVRMGEPPNVTVGKGGDTCDAGAGSIWINAPHGWHGHLVGGFLVKC